MKINIEDLPEGNHHLQLDGAPEALALPTDEGTFARPIHVEATITKTGNNMVLQADISTEVVFLCGRCLAEYSERLTGHLDVLYEKTERVLSDTAFDEDDVEVLDYDAKEIDIGRRIEEVICLAMPLKPLCRETCKGLCSICGEDLNHVDCTCRTESVDPRWQVLKEMFE